MGYNLASPDLPGSHYSRGQRAANLQRAVPYQQLPAIRRIRVAPQPKAYRYRRREILALHLRPQTVLRHRRRFWCRYASGRADRRLPLCDLQHRASFRGRQLPLPRELVGLRAVRNGQPYSPSSVFDVPNVVGGVLVNPVTVLPKQTKAITYQAGSVFKQRRFTFDGDYYYVLFGNGYTASPDPNAAGAERDQRPPAIQPPRALKGKPTFRSPTACWSTSMARSARRATPARAFSPAPRRATSTTSIPTTARGWPALRRTPKPGG